MLYQNNRVKGMKRTWLIALLLAAFTPIFAFEYTYEGNTLKYTILTENTVSVQKGTTKLKGVVKVPAQVVDPNTDKTYDVTHIADEGFRYNATISVYTSIVLPEGLQVIGYKAFAQCVNLLGELRLPSTVTMIKSRAFYNCGNVTNIVITSMNPPTLSTELDGNRDWFYNVDKITVPAKQGVLYRHGRTSENWGKYVAKSIPILEPTEALVDDVYYRLDNAGVVLTGGMNFSNKILDIPSQIHFEGKDYSVKGIADSAFMDNVDIISLSLPEGLERIGEKAFARSNKIAGTVIFPSSLNRIDGHAFFHSSSISTFISKSLNAPELENTAAFEGTTAPIYVSCEALDNYKTANKWSDLSSRIKDACLTIYHDGTPKEGDGVYEATIDQVASITYKRTFTPGKWETLYLPFEIEKVTVEDEDEIDGYWSPEPWNIFDGGDYFLAEATGIEDGELCFDFTTASPVAHKPYLIQFPILEGEWSDYYVGRVVTFHGKEKWNNLSTSFAPLEPTSEMQMGYNNTLQNQTISDEVYVLRATDDFILQHSATTLHPFECYVMPQKVSGAALAPRMSVRLRGKNDVTTSISSTQTNQFSYTKDGNVLTVYSCGQPLQIYSISGELLYDVENQESAQFSLDKGCYIIYSNGNSQKVIL